MLTSRFALEPVDVQVGVDGSENSEQALCVALTLARKHDWSVRLVGAYSVPAIPHRHAPVISHDHHRGVAHATQDFLEGCAADARRSGVDAVAQAIEGDPAGVLVDASHFARFTVVGRRGRNQTPGRLLGTVSGRLVAHAPSPVLVVPLGREEVSQSRTAGERDSEQAVAADAGGLDHGSVVAGIDLGMAAPPVAEAAAKAAGLIGGPLTLLSVVPTGARWSLSGQRRDDADAELRDEYSEHLNHLTSAVTARHPQLDVRFRVETGSAAGALIAAARTAAVAVVGTRGRGGFASLLLGSVSRAVLNEASSPVLVVPTGSREVARKQ